MGDFGSYFTTLDMNSVGFYTFLQILVIFGNKKMKKWSKGPKTPKMGDFVPFSA